MATRSEKFDEACVRGRARRGVALLGVCNVTPDSFSDGGLSYRLEDAKARARELVAEGADVVDIGAESTRPGAEPVPAQEQLRRLLDVVRYAASLVPVSVDTTLPEVAAACLDAGAVAVNDVSCLADDDLAKVTSARDASLVLMHARGSQAAMRGFSDYPESAYEDVVADVLAEWGSAAERAQAQGVPKKNLVMDPGLGFAKSARQSADLLRRTRELVAGCGVPVLIGASRKSFLTIVDETAPPSARIGASLAAAMHAAHAGASMLRVHDVRATAQALSLARLLSSGRHALGEGSHV